MDNEGKLKELNIHDEEYASNYLTARNTYYVFKIESNYSLKYSLQFSSIDFGSYRCSIERKTVYRVF